MNEYKLESFFSRQIIQFSKQVDRDLPWKGDNPYFIWLSEIILQQTRVEQGKPYFHKFIKQFPTLKSLACASEDEVLKTWQGLGYYTRARNLHETAKVIHFHLKGRFPQTKEQLIKLKGIGEYTAAAIASFAFNQPEAVVDGNVYRLLSRFFGNKQSIYISGGKAHYQQIAQRLIDVDNPGEYNQAIMDLGALICKPKIPECLRCPLRSNCFAFNQDKISDYPIPKPKISKKLRHLHYFVVKDDVGQLLIRKRNNRDIWKGLFEFPYLETQDPVELSSTKIRHHLIAEYNIHSTLNISKPQKYRQTLTHQHIIGYFYQIEIKGQLRVHPSSALLNLKNLSNFAFPKIIDCYLRDNYINLYI